MTLILFIPHKDGFLLVGDRQDTHYETNEKFDFNKLFLKSANGPAIGSSGSTDLIRLVYSHLNELDLTDEKLLFKKIQDKILQDSAQLLLEASKYSTARYTAEELRLEMLLLYKSETLKLVKLTNYIFEPIADLARIHAVPELNPEAKRFLEINTVNLSEIEAIEVAKEILQQTCFGNFTIGPPEYHGYDVITISKNGAFTYKLIDRLNEIKSPSQILESTKLKNKVKRLLFWKLKK